MTPRQLLEKLEKLGLVDSKVLDKIRKEIDNPEKTVKPKAVLNYLVKKKQITEKQAKQLLESDPPPRKTEDEIEVVQPIEKDYDTDDLTGLVNEVEEESPPVVPPTPPVKREVPEVSVELDYGKTLTDDGVLEDDPSVEVADVFDPVDAGNGGAEPVDPLLYDQADDGGYENGGFDSGAHSTENGEHHSLVTFKGKRDKRDQWSTKWLYIGFGVLGTLLIGVAILWIVNIGQKPEDMFEAAMDSFNKGSYADATKKLEDYLEQYPNHRDAPTARARRIHSIIRGTYGLKNYPEVIQQANTLLPELEAEEEGRLDLLREDLAVMLPSSLATVSQKATKVSDLPTMEKELTVINDYRDVVENPVYIPNSLRKTPSVNDNYLRIDNNIRMLKGQIDKEKRYQSDLVAISQLDAQKKTDEAFEIYQKLTRNYGDLASRNELRALMQRISVTEQELVVPVEANLTVSDQPRPTIVENSVVMAVKSGEPVPGLKDEVVNFLVDGSVYGVDAGEGTIDWRRFVGYQTVLQPVSINDETIAVSDQRNHDLIALDRRTGNVVWRTEIGEPFLLPTIGDQGIIVTTDSGKVVQLNANTGETEKSVQLPQPADVSALAASRDPYVYQLGSYQNLYVLSNQDYSCVEVHYLGHYDGSIAVPPQAWTGFILVAVNGGGHCNLHVLKPQDNGRGLELVQVISSVVAGTVSTPLERFGRWMLLTSDSGEMKILELYPAEEQNPVRVLTQDVFDAKGGQRAFMKTEGSNLWVAGQGIMRYRIQRNLGEFGREILVEPNDTFLSPVHKLDDYLLHVRQRNRSGMVSVSLVNAMTLKPVWRTDIGGELAGPPITNGDRVTVVSNQGDLFSLDSDAMAAGYTDSPVRASSVVEDLKFESLIPLANDSFACIGPLDRKDLLFGDSATGKSKLLVLSNRADQPACLPIAIGQDLILPTRTGQVARIDATTGQIVGTPFQPPLQANAAKPVWFEPTLLANDQVAIAAGPGEGSGKSQLYVLACDDRRVIKKVGELESEAPLKSRLANNGSNVFGVVAAKEGDQLVSYTVSPLAVGSQVALDGAMVGGPWLTEAGILILMDNDKLSCFETDLSLKWSVDAPNEKFACPPEVAGTQLMLCYRKGKINLLDPATGKTGTEIDVQQPIIHRPLRVGQKMYCGGLDGTVHVIDLSQLPLP